MPCHTSVTILAQVRCMYSHGHQLVPPLAVVIARMATVLIHEFDYLHAGRDQATLWLLEGFNPREEIQNQVSFNRSPYHGSFNRRPTRIEVVFHCRGQESLQKQLIVDYSRETQRWHSVHPMYPVTLVYRRRWSNPSGPMTVIWPLAPAALQDFQGEDQDDF